MTKKFFLSIVSFLFPIVVLAQNVEGMAGVCESRSEKTIQYSLAPLITVTLRQSAPDEFMLFAQNMSWVQKDMSGTLGPDFEYAHLVRTSKIKNNILVSSNDVSIRGRSSYGRLNLTQVSLGSALTGYLSLQDLGIFAPYQEQIIEEIKRCIDSKNASVFKIRDFQN